MDQLTPFRPSADTLEQRTIAAQSPIRRLVRRTITAVLLLAILATGYRLGRSEFALPNWLPSALVQLLGGGARSPAPQGDVIYYRDPDGRPYYSAEPRQTADGRNFIAVRASEDVSFDGAPQPQAQSGGQKRILYYRNPMGLSDTSPVPRKDSMGMDYIPVYEGEGDDGAVIKLSPGRLQRTGVRSETIMHRVVVRPVRVPGTIQLDERRITVVATRSDAFIDSVENITTGDRVKKGQSLLRLYSADIVAAAAQLISNAGFEGSRRRLQNLNVPPEVIAEIERTRKVPPAITWSSPRDGLVLERNAIEGMKAPAGAVLFRIADVSVVWVLASVPEHDLGHIKIGQAVTIHVRSLPGRAFVGKVDLIYPQVNTETRTTRVRIELENPDGVLLPDMYADVEIATGSPNPVLAVPDSAVIDTGTRQVVLLDKGEGRFEPREVNVGSRGNGFTEIREGLADGDRVVVTANFLIDAESNLKAALRALDSRDPPK
jgi:Cu(I)/Ag(I) efflux system membrane fusion protein